MAEVLPPSREELGRLVHKVWVEWAAQQPDSKPSWLLPWEEIDDGQQEVDMRIGEVLFASGREVGTFIYRLRELGCQVRVRE